MLIMVYICINKIPDCISLWTIIYRKTNLVEQHPLIFPDLKLIRTVINQDCIKDQNRMFESEFQTLPNICMGRTAR